MAFHRIPSGQAVRYSVAEVEACYQTRDHMVLRFSTVDGPLNLGLTDEEIDGLMAVIRETRAAKPDHELN